MSNTLVKAAPNWRCRGGLYIRWDGVFVKAESTVDGTTWMLNFHNYKFAEYSEDSYTYRDCEPVELPLDATFQQVLAYVDGKYPMAPWWRPEVKQDPVEEAKS